MYNDNQFDPNTGIHFHMLLKSFCKHSTYCENGEEKFILLKW